MRKASFYFVNAITMYRLVASVALLLFALYDNMDLFKWFLPISFFTDLIDGFLARKFKVNSVFGSRLDSIADDLTLIAAIIGVFVFKMNFILDNLFIVVLLISLLALQNIYAFARYHKLSSFHTYMAKIAAVFQGVFLIFLFLLPQPVYWLFYVAAVFSVFDLLEEIILITILPKWEADVKGLYWVYKRKKRR